jgi:hypothetical protein
MTTDNTFYEVNLFPSEFVLDVYTGDEKDIPKLFSKRYGNKKKFYRDTTKDESYLSYVVDVHSTEKSHANGDIRIVLVLNKDKYSPSLLVHELVHVLWHFSNLTCVGMDYKTQEWQALFMEHLFKEISKIYEQSEDL